MINTLFLLLFSILTAFGQAPASDVDDDSVDTYVDEQTARYCERIEWMITAEKLIHEYIQIDHNELGCEDFDPECKGRELADMYAEEYRIMAYTPVGTNPYGRLRLRNDRTVLKLIKRYERELPSSIVQNAREIYHLGQKMDDYGFRGPTHSLVHEEIRKDEAALAGAGVNLIPFDFENPQPCPAE